MSSIKPIELRFIDQLFERPHERGYVLDFTNRTFFEFFRDELRVNIDDPAFQEGGTSKMNRLRCFLRTVNDKLAAKAIRALWDYRQALGPQHHGGVAGDAETRLRTLLERLDGRFGSAAASPPVVPASTDAVRLQELRHALLELAKLDPQPRGFAFEKFLKALFDISGLAGRHSFRLTGEQIDGSFELGHETYLLEAKWQKLVVGAGDLHAFNGKIEEKAAWSRGLFLSYCGFSDEGLAAFGKGKRVVCMDGLDLHETMDRGLPLGEVIAKKVRRAAETGQLFASVRDLFP